ncbi:MAG TPA: SIMPL domain-containing protein [Streptosporangiaceae bacterium]
MPSEPVISVRGEAVLEVEPEVAVVFVTVMARDKDRRRALDLLAERNRQVATLIKGYGDAVEKLESEPVRVHPAFKDDKARERVTGYVARAGFQVTVSDFAVLGELVPRLADEEMVALGGPSWRLRPDSRVYREARLTAARDATQRAREYAEAFGGRVTGLVEAADTGLLGTQPEPRMLMRAAVAGGRAEMAPPQFDFEPAKQTVHAQVEARFTMTAPQFSE